MVVHFYFQRTFGFIHCLSTMTIMCTFKNEIDTFSADGKLTRSSAFVA